ncbi:hypothetical protein B7P43_G13892 [Cryptotermes secundus]|uniref:Unconventional prefoldin RPB5 interactor n=1 Tax=Cryptotermes secundus TaxID=105785 RepID=A0A2J7Q9G9_9NEOP|nr:unconventional prefoldin RPB5 interactor 1 [Cryptotermes secundus]PNF25233.1 hypothetical protein B7P43_G13892 [Cryptotermes secundus]
MEANIRLKTLSDDPTDLKLLLQQTHDEALQKNEYATKHWLKLRDEHMSLHSHLGILPDKLSHDVMVPIGSKALMRGKMVHTNEILVCLGDGWFVKRSAKEAAEICDRRIKLCDNMLKDLEREHNLLLTRKELPLERDAFGAETRREILEPYDEKTEAEWRVQHRQKEKEYRQKLTELRNKEKTKIDDEESLWKRLDELELQEELEEELDRFHADREDMEYDENSELDTDTDEESDAIENYDAEYLLLREQIRGANGLVKQDIAMPEHAVLTEQHESRNGSKPQAQSISSVSPARRVSFADDRTADINEGSDSDSSAECLRIEFQHTPVESGAKESTKSDGHPIQTPANIHEYIKELMAKNGIPKSILKNKSTDQVSRGNTGPHRMQWLQQPDSIPIITQEMEEPLWNTAELQPVEELDERPVVFGCVHEHSSEEPLLPPEQPIPTRPVSRFKAARLAAKR